MKKIALILLILPFISLSQNAKDIIQKAVEYHDPNGEWKDLVATFTFKETRPGGPDRKTIVEFNNGKNWHLLNRDNETIYEVDGKGNVKIVKGEGTIEGGKVRRNFYVFLWGLPMKLEYPSTPVQTKVESRTIDGINCHGVKVNYEKETYTFFFSKENYRMVAYEFWKNDDSGKGEFISLKDEVKVGNMRIPKERSWYELPSNKYLGTDILTEAK